MQKKGGPRFFNSNKTQADREGQQLVDYKEEVMEEKDDQMNQYYKDYKCSEQENLDNNRYRKENMIKIVEGPDNLMLVRDFGQLRFDNEECECIKQGVIGMFNEPTPIQSQSWPIIFQGRDLIGIAKTGSGKTLGYLLPMFMNIVQKKRGMKTIDKYRRGRNEPMGLVIGPTRELVQQIYEESQKFSRNKLVTNVVYGGKNKYEQKQQLNKEQTDILMATPGRLIDLVDSRVVDLSSVQYMVLDEADRMLEMGFEDDIRNIIAKVNNSQKQLCMWSATWPRQIRNLARQYMNDAIHIQIGQQELTVNVDIQQFFFIAEESQKLQKLEEILQKIGIQNYKCLLFCQTKKKCDFLSKCLENKGIRSKAIHSDKEQSEREYILKQFKENRCNMLVASDVAARGLDIKDIQIVINVDLPNNMESYVHRIGRTGRAGNKGVSISLFSELDQQMVSRYNDNVRQTGQKVSEDMLGVEQVSRKSRNIYGFIQQKQEQQQNVINLVSDFIKDNCQTVQVQQNYRNNQQSNEDYKDRTFNTRSDNYNTRDEKDHMVRGRKNYNSRPNNYDREGRRPYYNDRDDQQYRDNHYKNEQDDSQIQQTNQPKKARFFNAKISR